MKDVELTQEVLKELLDYDSKTGIFTWNFREISWFRHTSNPSKSQKQWNSRFKGSRAGNVKAYPHGKFYRRIGICGKIYYEHRVAWMWMTGQWPEDQIDHINHRGVDNRWDNLRKADCLENGRNRSKYVTNTSGHTGVRKRYTSSGRVRWIASIYIEYKNVYLGSFDTIEDAIECRDKANRKVGYHELHGEDY